MERNVMDVLLRAAHDLGYKKLSNFVITIRHRGAPNDEKTIDGSRISNVQKDGFWYINPQNEEIFIPAHRIIKLEEVT
jgi:uncharacterized protein (UPF0248 family)